MSEHLCHAVNCQTAVPPRMFMCARHWRMVPKPQQDAVWAAYQRGQERREVTPTPAYFRAARHAQVIVGEAEGVAVPQGYYRTAGLLAADLPEEVNG